MSDQAHLGNSGCTCPANSKSNASPIHFNVPPPGGNWILENGPQAWAPSPTPPNLMTPPPTLETPPDSPFSSGSHTSVSFEFQHRCVKSCCQRVPPPPPPRPKVSVPTMPPPSYMLAPPPFLPIRRADDVRRHSINQTFTHCVFCKNNGEDETFYNNHTLKDDLNQIRCPVLRAYVCPICLATGSGAHTISHCPYNLRARSSSTVQQQHWSARRRGEEHKAASGEDVTDQGDLIRSRISEMSMNMGCPEFEEPMVLGNQNPNLGAIGDHLRRNRPHDGARNNKYC